jgi:hypothetical protein
MFQTTNQMVICSNKREQEDGIQAALSSLDDTVRCPELSYRPGGSWMFQRLMAGRTLQSHRKKGYHGDIIWYNSCNLIDT